MEPESPPGSVLAGLFAKWVSKKDGGLQALAFRSKLSLFMLRKYIYFRVNCGTCLPVSRKVSGELFLSPWMYPFFRKIVPTMGQS